MAYCSIMTLLLAFFIILQAFAPTQNAGLFYTGQGSFIRALETFGLGGLLDGGARSLIGDDSGARYLATEGLDDPGEQRSIDPELEAAEKALAALEEEFDVRKPDSLTGWRATLPTPVSYASGRSELTSEEKDFCKELAWRLAPLMLARGFVIRIGAELQCASADELAHTRLALSAAGRVRSEIIRAIAPRARGVAARRLYCFCRRAGSADKTVGAAAGRLRIDILLTKPHIGQLERKGTDRGESQTQG